MGESTRLLAAAALLFWAGATIVLAELPWFRRRPLVERLRPHVPGAPGGRPAGGVLSVSSFREVLGPLSRVIGDHVSRAFGVRDELEVRLARARSPLDHTGFRTRQLGWSAAGFAGGAALAAATGAPALPALLFVAGGPLLAFLVVEQQLSARCRRRQDRILRELPVLSEQLGMLLGAGYSLGAALSRLAARGSGACAEDLAGVRGRVQQGVGEVDALREWSATAGVEQLDRLVGVLALNREAGDLGRLISEEARSIRREMQRRLVEEMDRRSQQVWIPVTVATLVPGSMLLAVPFIDALRLFSSS